MSGEPRVVVMDIGSHRVRVGMGGDDAPKKEFASQPSLINRGVVTHWKDMEKIWHTSFYEVNRVDPTDTYVLATEAVGTPPAIREKIATIMFESFNVMGLCFQPAPVLALYAAGSTTGLALNVGHGVTQAVPVLNGQVNTASAQRSEFAGQDLTEYMQKLLTAEKINPAVARGVKEQKDLCYVSANPEAERAKPDLAAAAFVLPDGTKCSVKQARFECAEALFNPKKAGKAADGLAALTKKAIDGCPAAQRKELWSKVVLSGGSTMFKGLPERLQTELSKLDGGAKVAALPDRAQLPWLGGSIFTTLPTFTEAAVIPRADYNEQGPSIFSRPYKRADKEVVYRY